MRFASAKSGLAGVTVALCALALVGAAAIGVDIGWIYLKSRQLQGAADLAAMAAAMEPANARVRAEAAARANGVTGAARVLVTLGRYEADAAKPRAERFVPGPNPNAARVRIEQEAPLFFAAMFVRNGRMRIARTATAAQARLASFQIGSRLLALRGGVPNALLSALTGSTVSLSVMDYDALAHADVDLFTYVEALRADLDLHAATYDQTLHTQMDSGRALRVLADALDASGDAGAARVIAALADAAAGRGPLALDALLDVGPYGAQDTLADARGARLGVNALDLANAILEIANGGRQVALDLGVGVPGLAQTRAWLAIGERPNNSPWLAVTDAKTVIIRTAQMRLYVEAELAAAGLASVRLPALIELASAQARLEAIECGHAPNRHRVTLSVAPSVGALSIADIDRSKLADFKTPLARKPARLAQAVLLTIEGQAHADLGGLEWRDVIFDGADIANGTVKTVQTRDIAQATVATLMDSLTLQVKPLALNANALTAALAPVLRTAAPALDGLINTLSDLLGVRLGEADVRINGVRCRGAALVG